jgi:hypothetical protein
MKIILRNGVRSETIEVNENLFLGELRLLAQQKFNVDAAKMLFKGKQLIGDKLLRDYGLSGDNSNATNVVMVLGSSKLKSMSVPITIIDVDRKVEYCMTIMPETNSNQLYIMMCHKNNINVTHQMGFYSNGFLTIDTPVIQFSLERDSNDDPIIYFIPILKFTYAVDQCPEDIRMGVSLTYQQQKERENAEFIRTGRHPIYPIGAPRPVTDDQQQHLNKMHADKIIATYQDWKSNNILVPAKTPVTGYMGMKKGFFGMKPTKFINTPSAVESSAIESSATSSPLVIKPNRCSHDSCKRRLNILDMELKCACKQAYCETHRHFASHDCPVKPAISVADVTGIKE